MTTIVPDPLYNPNFQDISSRTKLGPGITIAKFLGAPGSKTQFERITEDKTQIARNLYLHAEIIRQTKSLKQFQEHRLVVSEGLYVPSAAANEEPAPPQDVNFYKKTGEGVVYQLIGKDGKPDHEKTFDLAAYWKDYIGYNQLILDYDTFNPDGSLTSQIVVIVPPVPPSFSVRYTRKIRTQLNTAVMSLNELVELTA